MKSDIPVVIADKVHRSGVLIDPNANAADVFNPETGTMIEANNVLAEGKSSRAALAEHYGR